jgi:hypothetical protein
MRDEENSSVYSGLSEESGEDDRLARSAADLMLNSGTPSFLLLDSINQGIEGIYKSGTSYTDSESETSSVSLGFPAVKKVINKQHDILQFAVMITKLNFILSKVDEPFSGVGGLKHDPIREAMFNFMLGQEVSLECFRSLADKKLLLAKALDLNEGNAILAVSRLLTC